MDESNNTLSNSNPTPTPVPEPTPTINPATTPETSTPESTAPEPTTPVANPVVAPAPAQTKKSPKKLLIIIVAILVLIGAVIAIILLLNKGSAENDGLSLEEAITQSDTFFISNSNEESALFNYDGEQITDFIFTSHSDFVNGAAEVKNKNDQYGIIGTDGKMIVDYGVCKYLSQKGALYSCTDEEHNDSLLDAKGKTLLKAEDIDVSSFIGLDLITIVEQENEKDDSETYIIYDYKGNILTTIPQSTDNDVKDITASGKDNYVSLFYNKTNYIFDLAKSKLLLTFNDDIHFCINSINEYRKDEFTLSSCSEWYSSTAKYEYKLIRDGKEVFTKKTKDSGNLYFEGEALIFKSDDGEYVVDENGNNVVKNTYIAFKDSKNYIVEAEGIGAGTDLFVNGSKKQHVDCNAIYDYGRGYAQQGIYALRNCKGFDQGNYIYMKTDGTVINKAKYERINPFDKYGYALVSEDAEKWHLINTDGEKVSDDYAERIIALYGDSRKNKEPYYYGTTSDGKAEIFKVGDKAIVSGDKVMYNFTRLVKNKSYVLVKKGENYTVYNLNDNKEIVTIDSEPYSREQYFTTSKDSKTQYYSYTTGKMFYEK